MAVSRQRDQCVVLKLAMLGGLPALGIADHPDDLAGSPPSSVGAHVSRASLRSASTSLRAANERAPRRSALNTTDEWRTIKLRRIESSPIALPSQRSMYALESMMA